jgi:hypothetical protein
MNVRSLLAPCPIFVFACLACAWEGRPEPVHRIVEVPFSDRQATLVGVEADAELERLVALGIWKGGAEAVVFDGKLNLLQTVGLPAGTKCVGLEGRRLLHAGASRGRIRICERSLDAEMDAGCVEADGVTVKLYLRRGVGYAVIDGKVWVLDFAGQSVKRWAAHFTVGGEESILSFAVGRGVFADISSGAARVCRIDAWQCEAVELLTPEQLRAKSTKHPAEGVFSKMFQTPKSIVVIRGRQRPIEGLMLDWFDFGGKYERSMLLQQPQFADWGSAMQVHFAEAVGDLLVLADQRGARLVGYQARF